MSLCWGKTHPFKHLIRGGGACLALGFLLMGWPDAPSWAQEPPTVERVPTYSNPAKKRGLEYGFDKGLKAGNTDKEAGLEPDLARHQDFKNPDRYYRYEFGSRAAFNSGFKSGFMGGYQQAFGKKVKLAIPDLTEGSTDQAAPPRPRKAPRPPDAASDAL